MSPIAPLRILFPYKPLEILEIVFLKPVLPCDGVFVTVLADEETINLIACAIEDVGSIDSFFTDIALLVH
jgi:hypothetical protein